MFVKLMKYIGKDKYVKHFFKIDGAVFDLHFLNDDGSPLLLVSQSGKNYYKEIQHFIHRGYRIIEIKDRL